jgi:hypothetical protein
MKKTIVTVLVAATLLALGACGTAAPGATHPAPGQRSGSFWAWIEDAQGGEIVSDVVITIDGFAEGPNGEPDTRWQDTGLPAVMPLELNKRAPFNQPIYWDPSQTVHLQVTVIFENAQLGDKVQCWQDDQAGMKLGGSERTTVRNLPGRGPISVYCSFIFH